MKGNLRKPCALCPFSLKAPAGWLGEWRASEIAQGINGGSHSTFTCHKTNEFGENEEGELITIETEESEHCGGAMLFLMNVDNPNLFMRFGFMFGEFKPSDFTPENRALVFSSEEEFIEHHS